MRTLILSAAACVSVAGFTPAGRAAELPARIRVLLPADAALTIDGEPTRSSSGRRDFVTPPLPAERDFTYDLRAVYFRNGNAVTVERRITVRAGQETVARLGPSDDGAPLRSAAVESGRPRFRAGSLGPRSAPAVGVPEDNWKPDASDPFYPWD